jgi:hypothetical protein
MVMPPSIAIVILVIILIIAGFACLMITPGKFDQSRIKTFITVFAGLSLILTVMFYYAVIGLQKVQGELLVLRETQQVQQQIALVVGDIAKSTCVIPEFCSELMPLEVFESFSESSSGTAKETSKCDNDSSSRSTHSSSKSRTRKINRIKKIGKAYELSKGIFSAFQTAVLEYKFLAKQEDYYNCLFLQWATSPILRKCWKAGKISLIPRAQRFGDLLFQYAPKTNKHCPDSYVRACEEMRETREYFRILSC